MRDVFTGGTSSSYITEIEISKHVIENLLCPVNGSWRLTKLKREDRTLLSRHCPILLIIFSSTPTLKSKKRNCCLLNWKKRFAFFLGPHSWYTPSTSSEIPTNHILSLLLHPFSAFREPLYTIGKQCCTYYASKFGWSEKKKLSRTVIPLI